MPKPEPLDLRHLGHERVIGAYLLETDDGLAPVPEGNIHPVGSEVLGLQCFPTPGHASHHVCFLDGDGTLFAGDAAGVRIQPSSFVLPPTPPPEFDPDAWGASLDEIERRG